MTVKTGRSPLLSHVLRSLRQLLRSDSGQTLPLVSLLMTLFFGMGALTVDAGSFWHGRQSVENAVDAGALAGAQSLPEDGVGAESQALYFVLANAPSLTPADVSITFRCLVGDRDHNGQPDPGDIPAACDPKADAAWFVASGVAVSPCVPAHGDRCNVIVVTASVTVPFVFAPFIGVDEGSTGDVNAAACRGACGGPPTTPMDVVVIIDRTGSMSGADISNARAATSALLQMYDPAQQWIALGLLGPSRTTGTTCGGVNAPARALAASSSQYATATWIPVGLTGIGAPLDEAYRNEDGTLNSASALVKAVNCFNTSSTGTNLSAPIRAASQYLQNNGRPDVRKGIIFETDGTPNYGGAGPASDYTCQQAALDAANAKAAGIEIVTVAFGLTSGDTCPDNSGAYHNVSVLQLLAEMATASASGECNDDENTDGDHFFCLPRTSQLTNVFQSAAIAIGGPPRLLTLPAGAP